MGLTPKIVATAYPLPGSCAADGRVRGHRRSIEAFDWLADGSAEQWRDAKGGCDALTLLGLARDTPRLPMGRRHPMMAWITRLANMRRVIDDVCVRGRTWRLARRRRLVGDHVSAGRSPSPGCFAPDDLCSDAGEGKQHKTVLVLPMSVSVLPTTRHHSIWPAFIMSTCYHRRGCGCAAWVGFYVTHDPMAHSSSQRLASNRSAYDWTDPAPLTSSRSYKKRVHSDGGGQVGVRLRRVPAWQRPFRLGLGCAENFLMRGRIYGHVIPVHVFMQDIVCSSAD